MIPGEKQVYPISAAQRILRWSEMFSIEPRKVKENNIISSYMRISDNCNMDALEYAYNELIKNNDSLRLKLFRTAHGIKQYIKDYTYTKLEQISVDGDAGFKDFLSNLNRYPVTFFDDNLVWAKLVIRAPGDCSLVTRIHHAVVDGYSIRLIFEQLEKYYDCYLRGETPDAPKTYSITKYFDLQDKYEKSEQHTADRKYWFHLYTHQRRLSFPAGYRSEIGDCASERMAVSHDTYQKLQALASRTNCTLQSLLMTLAAVTTYVVTGKENFAIFSLTHGRLNQYLKNTVGCMMNTVNVFFDLKPDTTIEKLLPECYLTFLDTLSHGRLPMGEQIPMTYIEAVKHFFNFNPGWLLFSCMEYGDLFAHSAYEMSMIHQTNQAHQFYLSMLDVAGERVDFELSYQTRRFKPEAVRQLLKAYYDVICCATDHPQWRIEQIRSEFKKGDKR
jgi:hypothetical protein